MRDKMAMPQKMKPGKNNHGIKSEGMAYFPKGNKEHSFPQANDIGYGDYPDTAEAMLAEQNGNIAKAKASAVKGMYRK